jgi:glycosyltransferase involved in cell wall biosynthesis
MGPGRLRRWLLPFYPNAVSQLGELLGAEHAKEPIDLLLSNSSAAIKGLRPPPGVPHLCCCQSPARYVWHRQRDYGGRGLVARLRSAGLSLYAGRFRKWDRATAANVTLFLANSRHTGAQVRRFYGAEPAVLHPPVRTGFFTPDPRVNREDFWLVVSALEPYKRVDLAIEAARIAGAPIVIAGHGSQRGVLERSAGPHARFLGRVSDDELLSLYRRAALFLFPQVEDFGIVAGEALACGLPVLARAEGGALDIVDDGVSGVLVSSPTPASIAAAADRAKSCSPEACRRAALRFSEDRFNDEIRGWIDRVARPARTTG